MAAINSEQKAVLDIAHSYYRQTDGQCYSFFMDQLSFNGIKQPEQLVNELLTAGLLDKCGPRFRISQSGINAVESDAIQSLENN